MRPSTLLYMYVRRLRAHGVQEMFAAIGVAIAVALVFGAIVAEQSISGSAREIVRTVVGPASLQVQSRDGRGFDQALLERVRRIRGVKQVGPLLEQGATIFAGPGRHARVQLAGTDLRLAVLDGLGETLPIETLSSNGISLSRASARLLGIAHGSHRTIRLALRGRTSDLRVSAVLGPKEAGALSSAYVAVMPLRHMQQLADLPGQVTRLLVQTRPGHSAAVRAALARLAGGRLLVAPADRDIRLLSQALGPSDLASGLFAAIGALLGFLLAFNAILLTVSDRRRTIADLRMAGASRATIVEMILFEALCLGAGASLLGLLVGYLLSTSIFHQSTDYLAEAFALSGQTVVSMRALGLSFAGGVLATCLASSVPLMDLRGGRTRDAIYQDGGEPGHALDGVLRKRLAIAALALLLTASLLWTLIPTAAIPATALLALATVLAVPIAFAGVLRLGGALSSRLWRISILPLALASLRATTVRSLALAATGAVALFGSVALGGARSDLLAGIKSFAHSYAADARIWVSNPGDNQAVDSFRTAAADPARIARLPGVAAVHKFQGGFVQLGSRRVWIVARPSGGERHVLGGQLRGGQPADALRRLERGGWVAVSEQIAAERHLTIGDALTLPTPTGSHRFRIAATTTNLAWPPGVLFMSTADYSRFWSSRDPTALGVDLRAGASPRAVRREIVRSLGPNSGLEVSLPGRLAQKIDELASEGLGQLQEISLLLLLAAIVSMVAALGSSIWQRRVSLAGLRLLGAGPLSLRGILLLEALLMLSAGCLTGALAGVYGQVVIDGFLRHVTGFPLASPTTSARPIEVLALVLASALAIGAIPGWVVSRVRPGLALASE